MKKIIFLTITLFVSIVVSAQQVTYEMLEDAIQKSDDVEFKKLTQNIALTQNEKIVLLNLAEEVRILRKSQFEIAQMTSSIEPHPELLKSFLYGIGVALSSGIAVLAAKERTQNPNLLPVATTALGLVAAGTALYCGIKAIHHFFEYQNRYVTLYQKTLSIKQQIYKIPEIASNVTVQA